VPGFIGELMGGVLPFSKAEQLLKAKGLLQGSNTVRQGALGATAGAVMPRNDNAEGFVDNAWEVTKNALLGGGLGAAVGAVPDAADTLRALKQRIGSVLPSITTRGIESRAGRVLNRAYEGATPDPRMQAIDPNNTLGLDLTLSQNLTPEGAGFANALRRYFNAKFFNQIGNEDAALLEAVNQRGAAVMPQGRGIGDVQGLAQSTTQQLDNAVTGAGQQLEGAKRALNPADQFTAGKQAAQSVQAAGNAEKGAVSAQYGQVADVNLPTANLKQGLQPILDEASQIGDASGSFPSTIKQIMREITGEKVIPAKLGPYGEVLTPEQVVQTDKPINLAKLDNFRSWLGELSVGSDARTRRWVNQARDAIRNFEDDLINSGGLAADEVNKILTK